MDLEEAQFGGLVYEIAEKEFGGSFAQDQECRLVKRIYQEYRQAGQPRNQKCWIRERLKSLFLCVAEKPNWVEGRPIWPFGDGLPMVFIGQFDVPSNSTVDEKLYPGDVLYFFGARHQLEGGFELRYAVVSQNKELRALVVGGGSRPPS